MMYARSMPTQHVQINEALFSRIILFGAPPYIVPILLAGWLAGSACLPRSRGMLENTGTW